MSQDAEPKVNLVQLFTEEFALTIVSGNGEPLASIPLGTNSKKDAKAKAEQIIASVTVADGLTDCT